MLIATCARVTRYMSNGRNHKQSPTCMPPHVLLAGDLMIHDPVGVGAAHYHAVLLLNRQRGL